MINATVEHNKVNTDVLNKTKDERHKLDSNFKHRCVSLSADHSVSNCNALVIEALYTLVNPTFIHYLKSIIN